MDKNNAGIARRRDKAAEKPQWQQIVSKVFQTIVHIIQVIIRVIKGIFRWIYNLRGIFMAVPVALAALYLAVQNMSRLPDEVGINLLETGEYQYLISRELAVMGPLLVTAACLLMMLLSRKTVYPWVISIFTLVLPVLIYITNVFPA